MWRFDFFSDFWQCFKHEVNYFLMFQDAQAEMVSRQLSINVVDVLFGVELLIVITK